MGQDSDQPSLKRIYIGEGDTIINRISNHNKDPEKDFWDEVVFFVSKDENLTKAHGRYLEARIMALIRAASRAVLVNGTEPDFKGLPEPEIADMEGSLHDGTSIRAACARNQARSATPRSCGTRWPPQTGSG